MPKHLYFNPRNFDELVLSGVLIELFKTDVEVHSHGEGETLRFVQGENVVENNTENIMRFANTISRHKIFGSNWQEEAVINMINNVCKDIEKKLTNTIESSELIDKIQYLNTFWFDKSNEWIKKKFFSCHVHMLTLSFAIQEKFPEILTKYQCFVELRRLFIEEKLLSKTSLIAMFTHPENKYQEFDLFPELESSIHEVRKSMGSTYGEDMMHENNSIIENYVEIVAQEIEVHELKEEKETEIATEQETEKVSAHIEEAQETNIQSHEHNTHGTEHHPPVQGASNVSTLNETDPSSYVKSPEKEASKIDPQHIVMSHVVHSNEPVVINMPSDIEVIQEEIHALSEIEAKIENHEEEKKEENLTQKEESHENHHQIEESVSMKKSLKESFSEHLTKPLEYSTKNAADEEEPTQEAAFKNETHEKKKEITDEKVVAEKVAIELKKEALIEEAESENYVSQENIQHDSDIKVAQNQASQEEKISEKRNEPNNAQAFEQNKAPESLSHNASVKGPQSAMKNTRIKSKEDAPVQSRETCKCEIF